MARAVGRVLPIAADDRDAIAACFAEAARADVVISSGGVSVGEFDYVREGLAMLGAVEQFSKVAMRPGKPLQFLLLPPGAGGPEVMVFGLPGNPASSMVSFELFVRPALRRLLGLDAAALPRRVSVVGELPRRAMHASDERAGCVDQFLPGREEPLPTAVAHAVRGDDDHRRLGDRSP